jgi:DNA-dependent metalloprotease WSS1
MAPLQNTLRLNAAPSSHPNASIIFIKPLPRAPTPQGRADHATADLFLRAIAAQCAPIMKRHWLSVTTLEEVEPNREFLGRNFNFGECIQLVLRRGTGRGSGGGEGAVGWLGFHHVQMVMMHELAHCREMNHSKRFWDLREIYVAEMRALWERGFTGEGFWGGGRVLGDLGLRVGGVGQVPSAELEGLAVCGGAFRSRGRGKRKRKTGGEELSWKEKKERRIEKKFGKNGLSLGADEDRRMVLEIGARVTATGNPRVAQSKRGRELRAAAALARFEQSRSDDAVKKEDGADGRDDADEYEDTESDAGAEDALDLDGRRLLDAKGGSMVRVCGQEDEDHGHVKQELEEMQGLERYFPRINPAASSRSGTAPAPGPGPSLEADVDRGDGDETSDATTTTESPSPDPDPSHSTHAEPRTPAPFNTNAPSPSPSITTAPAQSMPPSPSPPPQTATTIPAATKNAAPPAPAAAPAPIACPICSLTNDPRAPTCLACSHVLDPRQDPSHWRCHAQPCQGTKYVNAGDAGVCGLCGQKRNA